MTECKEKFIVKSVKNGKVVAEKQFAGNCENAYFTYIREQLNKGYYCFALKYVNDRCWCKIKFYPCETMQRLL